MPDNIADERESRFDSLVLDLALPIWLALLAHLLAASGVYGVAESTCQHLVLMVQLAPFSMLLMILLWPLTAAFSVCFLLLCQLLAKA